MPVLFRNRIVLLPTFYGLSIFCFVFLSFILIAFYTWPRFLFCNQPLNQGYLIVEGWLSQASLEIAAQTFKSGNYQALIVSGGPIEDRTCSLAFSNYAEKAAYELNQFGISNQSIIIAPTPKTLQDRTYKSAIAVRNKLHDLGYAVNSLDIFSGGPHTRRSQKAYQLSFGKNVMIGTISAPPVDYIYNEWWKTSAGFKDVLTQTFAYLWTLFFFNPEEN